MNTKSKIFMKRRDVCASIKIFFLNTDYRDKISIFSCISTLIQTIWSCCFLFFIDIHDCVGIECLNDGSCLDHPGSYTCKCKQGFEGKHCETGT